ncbi:hypothetical protein BD626DRAFT_575802 [Schizophyllum amplum]|uniref:Uncharacterized protein n=1 Tax=Schizophyllum amplum TaxID=97359 RepID=A0A550BUX3_9AGAR|nr:hypothetical protein BD626DRAFT_575802 [Auriculariopsis ampla]
MSQTSNRSKRYQKRQAVNPPPDPVHPRTPPDRAAEAAEESPSSNRTVSNAPAGRDHPAEAPRGASEDATPPTAGALPVASGSLETPAAYAIAVPSPFLPRTAASILAPTEDEGPQVASPTPQAPPGLSNISLSSSARDVQSISAALHSHSSAEREEESRSPLPVYWGTNFGCYDENLEESVERLCGGLWNEGEEEDPLAPYGAIDGVLPGKSTYKTHVIRCAVMRYESHHRDHIWDCFSEGVETLKVVPLNPTVLWAFVSPDDMSKQLHCVNPLYLQTISHLAVAGNQIISAIGNFFETPNRQIFLVDPGYKLLEIVGGHEDAQEVILALVSLLRRLQVADRYIESRLQALTRILANEIEFGDLASQKSTLSSIRSRFGTSSPRMELAKLAMRPDYREKFDVIDAVKAKELEEYYRQDGRVPYTAVYRADRPSSRASAVSERASTRGPWSLGPSQDAVAPAPYVARPRPNDEPLVAPSVPRVADEPTRLLSGPRASQGRQRYRHPRRPPPESGISCADGAPPQREPLDHGAYPRPSSGVPPPHVDHPVARSVASPLSYPTGLQLLVPRRHGRESCPGVGSAPPPVEPATASARGISTGRDGLPALSRLAGFDVRAFKDGALNSASRPAQAPEDTPRRASPSRDQSLENTESRDALQQATHAQNKPRAEQAPAPVIRACVSNDMSALPRRGREDAYRLAAQLAVVDEPTRLFPGHEAALASIWLVSSSAQTRLAFLVRAARAPPTRAFRLHAYARLPPAYRFFPRRASSYPRTNVVAQCLDRRALGAMRARLAGAHRQRTRASKRLTRGTSANRGGLSALARLASSVARAPGDVSPGPIMAILVNLTRRSLARDRHPRRGLSASTGVSSAPLGLRAGAQERARVAPGRASSEPTTASPLASMRAPSATGTSRPLDNPLAYDPAPSVTSQVYGRTVHPHRTVRGVGTAPSLACAHRHTTSAPVQDGTHATLKPSIRERKRPARGDSASRGGLRVHTRSAGVDVNGDFAVPLSRLPFPARNVAPFPQREHLGYGAYARRSLGVPPLPSSIIQSPVCPARAPLPSGVLADCSLPGRIRVPPRRGLSASTDVSSAPRGLRTDAQGRARAFPERASSEPVSAGISRADQHLLRRTSRGSASYAATSSARARQRRRLRHPSLVGRSLAYLLSASSIQWLAVFGYHSPALRGYEDSLPRARAPSPARAQRLQRRELCATRPSCRKLKSALAPLRSALAANTRHLTCGISAYRGGLHALTRFAGFNACPRQRCPHALVISHTILRPMPRHAAIALELKIERAPPARALRKPAPASGSCAEAAPIAAGFHLRTHCVSFNKGSRASSASSPHLARMSLAHSFALAERLPAPPDAMRSSRAPSANAPTRVSTRGIDASSGEFHVLARLHGFNAHTLDGGTLLSASLARALKDTHPSGTSTYNGNLRTQTRSTGFDMLAFDTHAFDTHAFCSSALTPPSHAQLASKAPTLLQTLPRPIEHQNDVPSIDHDTQRCATNVTTASGTHNDSPARLGDNRGGDAATTNTASARASQCWRL